MILLTVCIVVWLSIGVYTMLKTNEIYPFKGGDVWMIPVFCIGGVISWIASASHIYEGDVKDSPLINPDTWKNIKKKIKGMFK